MKRPLLCMNLTCQVPGGEGAAPCCARVWGLGRRGKVASRALWMDSIVHHVFSQNRNRFTHRWGVEGIPIVFPFSLHIFPDMVPRSLPHSRLQGLGFTGMAFELHSPNAWKKRKLHKGSRHCGASMSASKG